MSFPIQITFRNMSSADAVDAMVRERALKLETFSTRITSCHVTVEAPHRHQHSGGHYHVRIDLVVPGGEVVVNHMPDESATGEDLYASVDRAFDQIGRRLEDHVRRQRGDVKAHEASRYRGGRVSKIWSYEGYGFLETPDGGEVYFHRNSVLHQGFERLEIGSAVQFIEEMGEKGPQASTVVVS